MKASSLISLYETLVTNMRFVEENFDTICFETLKTILRLKPECGNIENRWISDYHDFVNISYNKVKNEIEYTYKLSDDEVCGPNDLFMLNNDEIKSVVEEVVSNYEKLKK